MLRKWLGLAAGWLTGVGISVAALGFVMGQVATGNRVLIGWIGGLAALLICGFAIWNLLQHRNDPPQANNQAQQQALKRQRIRGACAAGSLVLTWAFVWTATSQQSEFENTLTTTFIWGTGMFLTGVALGIIRDKYTKGKDKK